MKLGKIFVAAATSGVLLSGAFMIAEEYTGKSAFAVNMDNTRIELKTKKGTVREVLIANDIPFSADDRIEPGLDTKVKGGETINIYRAREITIVDGETTTTRKTTYRKVEDILKELNITLGSEDKVTPELSSEVAEVDTIKITRNSTLAWARPDAKSQVTLAYDENGKLLNVDTVVLSVQHNEDVTNEQIEKDLKEFVIKPVLEKYNLNIENVRKFHINPTGRFVIGGPHGDSGLTGRKIIIDTYGGYFRHGGGAFSGKDPSKVDRSAAYAARWIAKNIVAAGFAAKCEVQLSYAIGVVEPVSIRVETFGTGTVEETRIEEAVAKLFDLTPNGIQKSLNLRKPSFRYQDLAAFGHIGRTDIDLPWEKLDKVEGLKQELGK